MKTGCTASSAGRLDVVFASDICSMLTINMQNVLKYEKNDIFDA
jgi:hypothetical protein